MKLRGWRERGAGQRENLGLRGGGGKTPGFRLGFSPRVRVRAGT